MSKKSQTVFRVVDGGEPDTSPEPSLIDAARLEFPLATELTSRRLERLIAVAKRRLRSVTVVGENLWDPHNFSAIVRTAEGLGLERVHVVEDPHPYKRHPGILHGADRWIRLVRHPTLESCLAELHADGFLTAAADVGEGCVPIDELPVDGPVAVVMGTEKAGLTDRAKTLTDIRFTIPMSGFTESFNVSVSAALALFDLSRRRRKYLGTEGDLTRTEQLELLGFLLERSRRRRTR